MKKRAALTAFLLVCMALLSMLFALQGTLLSSNIEAFSLTSSNQGMPSSAAFIGGIMALFITFVFSHKYENGQRLQPR